MLHVRSNLLQEVEGCQGETVEATGADDARTARSGSGCAGRPGIGHFGQRVGRRISRHCKEVGLLCEIAVQCPLDFPSVYLVGFWVWCGLFFLPENGFRLIAGRSGDVSRSGFSKFCAADIFRVFHRKPLRYTALGTVCTRTAVPRLTQLSTLRGTANEYKPYGWVINVMAVGEYLFYGSLPADSRGQVCSLAATWSQPTFIQVT